MENDSDQNVRLVNALLLLTEKGEAVWVRDAEEGFIVCSLKEDILHFRIQSGEDEFVSPEHEEVLAISSSFRGVEYLWLRETGGWDGLLSLLCGAKLDAERYYKLGKLAQNASRVAIERMASGARSSNK
ncbi:hypothetical protein [Isoalcanivorax indicus]|uniref:hypothetical protein n=1 Tax=Isoalcanivorax indicus TaxID=2202653 RepID=UPI000DB9D179|nr:hypothetical protein [Isoalcanivorax indicus]